MWYSAYGVDDERVTLILSPGVMVSFSDSFSRPVFHVTCIAVNM